ncbi:MULTISPECIES: DUF5330 domain-containing protein [Rhizobium]|uniref:DUF5330 domain-containing protein n=1 Tax=Rhizobium tropici TaxID=398 RepID=A0A6P1CB73_RHITR|nr:MULTISPECIES: DUF5330 domain-containing protein [Rhizobium]AGB70483.1 hypothetical protein RTCIAT899_CH05375 [Rhizobium tropici CIAT 899]MBB4241430.1 hypothetical protein [Rhizobium tropici]MBB5592830.1 hypothetical protein [Rhizobium tropici]MBB6491872.1 hypothetical protein [Rhizobium tropici]NEV14360.1 DUF5330 domain-containing protein [Rhizobium tropici]
MWFLIRAGFWFSLVLMFLPIFAKPEGAPRPAGEATLQVSDAISAASGVVQYVGAMCNEKPDVCAKGGETLTALGYQVGDGARVAYDMLGRHFKDQQSAAEADVATPHANTDQVAAMTQPMPAKRIPGTETADVVVTGTVKLPSSIPLPMPRPHI